jgi:hypothetical protein
MRSLVIAFALAIVIPSVPAGNAQGSCPVDTTPDFTDSCYHEYLLYDVDQPEIDILILPSASPYALRDSIILEQSIQAWDDGINNLGPSWLASGLNLHWYSVGLDPIPDEALWDPEIIVIPAEFNPVLLAGIGLMAPLYWCHNIPSPFSLGSLPDITALPGFHQHEGSVWGMFYSQCNDGGFTCFVVNTNFLWTPDAANRRDMYDLNSHELGHCLGIGHVGDALDFKASAYPKDDIMSYASDGHDPLHVLCVSTLNILALEHTYGHLIPSAPSGYPSSSIGGFVHMHPSDWSADSCNEPTASYTDLTPVLEADPLGLGGSASVGTSVPAQSRPWQTLPGESGLWQPLAPGY